MMFREAGHTWLMRSDADVGTQRLKLMAGCTAVTSLCSIRAEWGMRCSKNFPRVKSDSSQQWVRLRLAGTETSQALW